MYETHLYFKVFVDLFISWFSVYSQNINKESDMTHNVKRISEEEYYESGVIKIIPWVSCSVYGITVMRSECCLYNNTFNDTCTLFFYY